MEHLLREAIGGSGSLSGNASRGSSEQQIIIHDLSSNEAIKSVYDVGDMLGKGSYGSVFIARRIADGLEVMGNATRFGLSS